MAGFAPTQDTLDLVAYGRNGLGEGFSNAPLQLVQNPSGSPRGSFGINLWAILDETDVSPETFTGDLDGDGITALGEDLNGDGTFDIDNEDIDGDGRYDDGTEDIDKDGNLDINEDLNFNGVRDAGEPDVDGDGRLDTEFEDFDDDGNLDDIDEDSDGDGILDVGGEDLNFDQVFDRGDPDDQDGLPWLQRIKGNLDPAKPGGFGTAFERFVDATTDLEVLAAKALVYRYALFADRFASHVEEDGNIGSETDNSGIAELGGNDLLVTLGYREIPGGDA